MVTPNLLAGNRFRLYRSAGGSPETFTFFCLATTLALTETNEYEDATAADCANPTAVMVRKSVLRSTQWGLTFSGIMDALLYAPLRADFAAQAPMRYQILVDQVLAAGGGTYTGAIWFESLARTKSNNGMVTFTATARGDDTLVWAPAAT